MRGLDLKVFKMVPCEPRKSSEMPARAGEGWGILGLQKDSSALFCFLFGASAFLFYILDFCQEFKNKIFLKKEFPCLQKSLKIFGLVDRL